MWRGVCVVLCTLCNGADSLSLSLSLPLSLSLSLTGTFTSEFRRNLCNEVWLPDLIAREIPTSDGIEPLDILTDEGRVAQMQSEGLPADRISTENGVIITQCR